MVQPASVQNAAGNDIPLVLDSDGIAGIPRGYGDESVSADDPGMHTGVVVVPAASGVVDTDAAAALSAALAAVALKKNYLSGFMISGRGATSAVAVEATITGLAMGTMRIWIEVPAGVALAITPLFVTFPNPLPASAENVAITLAVPSFGVGNTDAECAVWGFTSA